MTRLSHPPAVPYAAAEREMLCAFLDAMRLAVRRKLEGVSDEQAKSTPTQCSWAREIAAGAASFDALAINRRFPTEITLRWIVVHMIEETARHAGHADIIREAVDGFTSE